MFGPNYTDKQRLDVFTSNIEDVLRKYELSKLDMVDLLFIPILHINHFYCMCFHMRSGKVEVIDNSAVEAEFDAKYGEIPKTLVIINYFR